MSNKIKLIVVSLILLVIVGINISYAISSVADTSSFFVVNKTELAQGEVLEMTINLSKINYNKFEFILSSNIVLEEVYTDKETTNEEDIILDEENNDILINIDKDTLNLNKIVLYYQIPENIELGTKIKLNVQIINTEEDDTEVVDKKQVEIKIVENTDEKADNQEESEDEEIEDEEDSKNDKNENQDENKNEGNKNEEENIDKDQQTNGTDETQSKNSNEDSLQNIQSSNSTKQSSSVANLQSNSSGNTSTSQTETATYNGSNNNYLSSLKIDGIELTAEFNKEKSTYFATTQDVTSITVTATAEDTTSKVYVTGTESLSSGENKILISVTAQNGDVRYYRIYVTNN